MQWCTLRSHDLVVSHLFVISTHARQAARAILILGRDLTCDLYQAVHHTQLAQASLMQPRYCWDQCRSRGRMCSLTGHCFTPFTRLVAQAHGVTRVVSADGAINNDHALNYLGRAGPIQYTNLGEVDSTSITRVFAHAVQAARDDAACDAGAILGCCKDGTNRSVAVAIVVVMATQGCSLAEAWEMVSEHCVRARARVCL
jgi:hypothetical protein